VTLTLDQRTELVANRVLELLRTIADENDDEDGRDLLYGVAGALVGLCDEMQLDPFLIVEQVRQCVRPKVVEAS
jgi:hypothetical protein